MLFSGVPFLYYFLPTVLLFYAVVPRKFKNAVLLLFSLIFYAWGEPKYVFLMLAAILLGFLFGHLIQASSNRGLRKMFLILPCSDNKDFIPEGLPSTISNLYTF